MTECQICLDLGDVVKLCHECFGPHYRLMHRIATNPEEEKKLADEKAFEEATGQKLPRMVREVPARDWRPGGMVKKNSKRTGKSKREVDMDTIAEYIREKFRK